jgi:branched-chain amino acid aminotransferase
MQRAQHEVREAPVEEMLYIADDVLQDRGGSECQSSVDRSPVGNGKGGPVTMALQSAFFDIVKNANDPHHWLQYVY